MPIATGIDAFIAFERQLRTLCLDEFPCGTGSWRTATETRNPATQFSVTSRDYGAGKEQEETLEELVTSKFSPYSVDYSWSREARQLREVAVKSPWLITREFILKHFRTIKIVDKNVNNVDKGMLDFSNLTELTLSANNLAAVDSRNLPFTLQVLELVANEISDLEPLCNAPPPGLLHLGLGLNRISALHDYLTAPYWPRLLSLDLSYNNLVDLKEVIFKLQTLPKLRNLVLIGNPLALIPGYRGYTVDSLRKLTILDDTQISADEKHHFKGLARRREFVRDEAKVVVKLSALSGIPMPAELQATEELPEFPIITRTYYVEFKFLEDFLNGPGQDGGGDGEGGEREIASPKAEDLTQTLPEITEESRQAETNGHIGDVEMNGLDDTGAVVEGEGKKDEEEEKAGETGEEEKSTPFQQDLKLVPFRTEGLPWSEEGMELVYEREILIDDLPALKELLKRGLDIEIKEDKVLSYPAEEDGRDSAASVKKGGKEKDGGKGEKRGASGASRTKDKQEKPKDAKGGKDDGKKKKKKEPEIELHHLPPEVTVLGAYHLDLAEFVNGETRAEEVCICEGGALGGDQEEEHEEEAGDGRKDKKKKSDGNDSAKGKKGKDAKQDKDKGKKQGKADASKEAKKDGGKGGAKRPVSGVTLNTDEEEEKPAPPLTVSVEFQLIQWKTAQDSIPKLSPPVPEGQPEEGGAENTT
ncbi:leucine-rich repeat-containing protein 43-like [Diadema antillarum]|uniref:leucine-rich repeat-containing protein 43-like n=1 Tax=Diadema antillarum TaxID=105358 RepID=UPI003A8399C5